MSSGAVQWMLANPEVSASLFIATCALVVSIYSGRLTRGHNRLSVRPHFRIVIDFSSSGFPSSQKVVLFNSGLGPGYLDELEVGLENSPYWFDLLHQPGHDAFVTVAEKATTIDGNGPSLSWTSFVPGGVLSVNGELEVFTFHHIGTLEAHLAVSKFLEQLEWLVRYRSFYGEKFESPELSVWQRFRMLRRRIVRKAKEGE